MKPDICIYHGNCADGFTAAWAMWKAFGDDVEFVPGVYGKAPPDVRAQNVVMVDFSYKRPVLESMAAAANSILILDHHKTAAADLAGLPPAPDAATWFDGEWMSKQPAGLRTAAIFDMERSGAQIAWDFFHPGERRPPLIDYVGDRDLWQFKLRDSRAIAAWLFSHPYEFEAWDGLAHTLECSRIDAVVEGEAIERKHFKDIDELLDVSMRYMVIGGNRVPVANLPYTMASDAAGKLAEGNAFAACYFDRADARVFSLRSRGPDGADVSEIAARYGGGGHKNAAGFQMPIGWEGDEA